jgi:hypothetical protein
MALLTKRAYRFSTNFYANDPSRFWLCRQNARLALSIINAVAIIYNGKQRYCLIQQSTMKVPLAGILRGLIVVAFYRWRALSRTFPFMIAHFAVAYFCGQRSRPFVARPFAFAYFAIEYFTIAHFRGCAFSSECAFGSFARPHYRLSRQT